MNKRKIETTTSENSKRHRTDEAATPIPAPPATGSGPPPPPPLPIPKTISSIPMVTMKKVNWQIIRPQNFTKDCIWSLYKDDKLISKEIITGLTANFMSKPAKKIASATRSINLRVIDVKSAQNLLILLRVFFKNSSNEQVKQNILRCDDVVNSNFIAGLIKCLPNAHQMNQLQELRKKGIVLIDAEEFIASLCDINRLTSRLHCMKFKVEFDDMIQKLESEIKTVTAACEEVITCQKFHKILRFILSIGNHMNAGSNIGGAAAFELPVLANLSVIRSADYKRTLLDFIVEAVEENWPDLLEFIDELDHLSKAVHVNVKNVNEKIKEMAGLLEFIAAELQNASINDDQTSASGDTFVQVMSAFHLKCQHKSGELAKMEKHMQNRCIELADFFSFDMNKYPISRCFADILTFKVLCMQKHNEIAKSCEPKVVTHPKIQTQSIVENQSGCKFISRAYEKRMVSRVYKVHLQRMTKEEIKFRTGSTSSGNHNRK